MSCWMGVRSRGEHWQSVAGRQRGGLQSVKSLSSLREGTASLGKPGSFSWTTVRSPPHTLSLFCTHTPDVSVLTNTRTISQTQTPLLVLSGSFLAVGLLLGPAQVALHLHKLGGVLLLFLNFLLLQLQLKEHRHTGKQH